MNVKLLRQVRDHILEEPRRFLMSSFFHPAPAGQRVVLDGIARQMPACGTAACIGGWAVILSVSSPPASWEIDYEEARRAVDIDRGAASRLFMLDQWPDRYYKRWQSGKTLKARAKTAADRINYFIRTKGKS